MSIKVIGWNDSKNLDFLPLEGEKITKEVVEAIILNIRENHYLFNGSDHLNKENCAPVLSNYRKVVLSLDDFNNLMRIALNDDKENRYPVYPSGDKCINERKDIYLRHKVSNKVFRQINNFFKENDGDLLHTNIYLLPISLDDKYHYWINDCIMLHTDGISEKIYTRINKIYSFESVNEFKNKINQIKEYDLSNNFGYSLSDIEKINNPFILLGIIKSPIDAFMSDFDILPKESLDNLETICKCDEFKYEK